MLAEISLQEGYEHISRSTLEGIVEHFQTLFDIPSVSGVLTRMTDIYQRFGEAQNVLNTLRHLLGLGQLFPFISGPACHHSPILVCVCVCMCVHICECVCARTHMYVCVIK